MKKSGVSRTRANGNRKNHGYASGIIVFLVMVIMGFGVIANAPAWAQSTPDQSTPETDAAPPVAGGGGSSLEDILKRQAGQDVPRQPRAPEVSPEEGTATDHAAGLVGPLGQFSDAQLWEALRFGTMDVHVSAGGAPARVVIQDGGMWWLQLRNGPLPRYGGWLLLGTIGALAVFYLLRGRVRVSTGLSGVTLPRFSIVERFGHWLLASSFLFLGISGLFTLFGRMGLISFLGKDSYAMLAGYAKWVHNNISWAFILGLIMVFVFWLFQNLPSRHDVVWVLKGGGFIGKAHPPAKKFNFGQKMVFWSVILLGGTIALSGLSLLFPFEFPLFARTFAVLNDWNVPALWGGAPLPVQFSPQEEMQYAQLWHTLAAFVLMAVILAHIYIGTLGMEGAFDAMGKGEVDVNWAQEHHSLWVDEIMGKESSKPEHNVKPAQ